MARDPNFVFEYLKQVEVLASDVLIDRRDIIEYNKKKEQLREASRALTKLEEKDELIENKNKIWTFCGNSFYYLDKGEAKKMIEKDQKILDEEINKLHKGLKGKVNKLYDAEKKPELKGYDLIPLTKEEKESIFNLVQKT